MDNSPFLPYGRQNIDEDDINAVVDVLKSDWMTQGPAIPAFEETLANFLDVRETIAVSNGTAALHLAMLALGIGPGDAIITTPITFLASANCARYVGADVIFADVDPQTGLIDPDSVETILKADRGRRIKAIIPVHLAGQPADLPALYDLARRYELFVVDDACHAIGATYQHQGKTFKIGNRHHSDMTVFSFHPVKHIAMGEGGAIATGNAALVERLRLLRNHGLERQTFVNNDMALNSEGIPNPWYYEMSKLGFNYRITDMQAALGQTQLKKLPQSLEKRNQIAGWYRKLIEAKFNPDEIECLTLKNDRTHAYHLFVLKINFDKIGQSRAVVMNRLRAQGIGTQVHYIPVHLQPYYQKLYNGQVGDLPGADQYYQSALSLPMYPDLTKADIERVVDELKNSISLRETAEVATSLENR